MRKRSVDGTASACGKDKTGGETDPASIDDAPDGNEELPGRNWRNGAGFARSPETSLAGITRIGCKGSLSASSRAAMREAPLFRQKSLEHKSGRRCKLGLPARRGGVRPSFFALCGTLAQCREYPSGDCARRRGHGAPSRGIKRQLSESLNNLRNWKTPCVETGFVEKQPAGKPVHQQESHGQHTN